MSEGAPSDLLETPGEVEAYVKHCFSLPDNNPVTVARLGGGVSGSVWRVDAGPERWVLKQALPKLNVSEAWYSDVRRIVREQDAMWVLDGLLPAGTVPKVVHGDPRRFAYMMTRAPDDADSWKRVLMNGTFDGTVAERLGALLRIVHAGSRMLPPQTVELFRDLSFFVQLRIEPFHRHVMLRYPELRGPIEQLIDALLCEPSCLVHGDFSPKNILVGNDSLMVIDFEVAHWGNPVFDLAFMIAHLMLKGWALDRAGDACALIESFLRGYGACSPQLLPHLGLMLLARLDGKSPVDYLPQPRVRERVRTCGERWVAGADATEQPVARPSLELRSEPLEPRPEPLELRSEPLEPRPEPTEEQSVDQIMKAIRSAWGGEHN